MKYLSKAGKTKFFSIYRSKCCTYTHAYSDLTVQMEQKPTFIYFRSPIIMNCYVVYLAVPKKGDIYLLQHIKRMKRWKIILLGSVGALLIIGICVVGYLYYQVRQINLADIEKRIEQRKQGQQEQEEGNQDVPGILKGSIDAASNIAGKSIDSQDALDVAAILMKSGLSVKEIYYLMGKSTDKLSNEEKQKIRDILLAKLSDDEIKALRAITTEYGKTLVILDKDYAIELVGVYDETERANIQKELDKKKAEANEQPSSPGTAATPLPKVSSAPEPSPVATAVPVPTEDSGAKAQELRTSYQSKLNTLKLGCTNKVSSIASEIAADISASESDGKGFSISTLQSKYLPKIESAESSCDSEFQQLMTSAQSDYAAKDLPLNDISIWKSQYEKAKQEAREQAMKMLMSSLSQ